MSADLVAQGRRSLLCGEVSQAVDSLQNACKQLASEHGELDERLGEPYLLYGSALLELARMENAVIGNALDGVPDGDSSSESESLVETGPEMTALEKEDLSNQVIDAMCEQPVVTDTSDPGAGDLPGQSPVDKSASSEDESSIEGEEEHAEAVEEVACTNGSVEKSNASDDEDDVTNLQLAWEVIEVAKKIFSAKTDEDSKLKVAECYEKLAEISREKENYSDALSDLKECLSIRTSLLAEDHRDVAEVHYQLGTTYAVAGDLDAASAEFKTTIKCLQEHSSNLELRISKIDAPELAEERDSLQNALQDVRALIPEVERRLIEIEEDRIADKLSAGSSSALTQPAGVQVEAGLAADDISHLVRKKRLVTPDSEAKKTIENNSEEAANCSPGSKRPKLLNGSSDQTDEPATSLEDGVVPQQA